MTTAMVLSGGGNYGPLQAGAVQALFENNVRPDVLVGVSAGALNAAWIASHPDLQGVQQLQKLWSTYAPHIFEKMNPVDVLFRLVRKKDGLLSHGRMYRVLSSLSETQGTFARFTSPRLYMLAARLSDGQPKVFGDDPSDRLIDGMMASAAIPPILPPWLVDGVPYVDGGVICNLPITLAIERGADEIYVLDIEHPNQSAGSAVPTGTLAIASRVIYSVLDRFELLEEQASREKPVRLHMIKLFADRDPGFWDFSRADELIATGYRETSEYLTGHAEIDIKNRVSEELADLCPMPACSH
jgi:NTE family protein